LVIRPSRRVNSCLDLIELFQLPTPLTSEDDKKRRNPHLAFPSLNKCNVVRATAAAIARGKRNLEGVLPSQRSTEIPGRSSQAAVLTVSPSFYLGRCESPLGNTESFLTSRCERHHCGCLPHRRFAKAVRNAGLAAHRGDGYRGSGATD